MRLVSTSYRPRRLRLIGNLRNSFYTINFFFLVFQIVEFWEGRYRKLSVAWKEAKSPPKSPEDAARFVILSLKRHQKADVQVHAIIITCFEPP